MSINATLLGQIITFSLFIWFTLKFVWPPIIKALHERQAKITEGLAAAERGHHDLELAQQKATDTLRDSSKEAAQIVARANRRGDQLVEEAKEKARAEAQRVIDLAQEDIQKQVGQAKDVLRKQVAGLAVTGAERLLGRQIDATADQKLLDDLIKEI